MECIKDNEENISKAVQVLRDGGIIAHPADTCYGLAGDLMNENILKKLQRIKGRDAKKPMSIMLPPYMKVELEEYASLNDFSEMVCEKLLPGPVTIILPKGPRIPDFYFPDIDTVGIRILYESLTNDLLTRFHGPLITTSANPSSQPVSFSCEEALIAFSDSEYQPDLFLSNENQRGCLPSTVISLKDDKITILREGPLKTGQIEAILGIKM